MGSQYIGYFGPQFNHIVYKPHEKHIKKNYYCCVNSVLIKPQDDGFVVILNGETLKGAFGELPLWFETEAAATHFASNKDNDEDKMHLAIQTLITQLRYNTGNPMHLNSEGILKALNADALFYPYPGPEAVEQYTYFLPMRNFLEEYGMHWRDLELSDNYTLDEAAPLWTLVQNLSLTQQARLLYLMLNTQNLFIAPLGYITGQISMHDFIQAWLYNADILMRKNSNAYKTLEAMMNRLNKTP
jgi:hypothetical protein